MSVPKSIAFIKLFVFINGAAICALEITSSRVLAPYFGTSLPVWGSVMGVTMIALAIGYSWGGRIADKRPNLSALGYLTLIAGILATFSPLLAKVVLATTFNSLIDTNLIIIIGSLIGMTLLFALPIMIMGMVSPYAVRIASSNIIDIGQTAGSLYSIATIGSIFGIFLPSFIMVPLLGSRITIVIFATLEILISILAIRQAKFLLLLTVPLLAALDNQYIYPDSIVELETPYQYVRVLKSNGVYKMKFNEGTGTQSIFDTSRSLSTNQYWDYAEIFPYFQPQKTTQNMLILGVAGATIATNIRDHVDDIKVNITGIEIDPQVMNLAKKYFDANQKALNYQIADGRVGVNQLDKKFDMIYVDAYTQQLYIPPHLATYEFFKEAKQKLQSDGFLIANVNSISKTGPLLEAIATTMDAVFNTVWIIPIPDSYNYLVLASDNRNLMNNYRAPDKFSEFSQIVKNDSWVFSGNGLLLTDDHAPLEFLTDWEIYQGIKGM